MRTLSAGTAGSGPRLQVSADRLFHDRQWADAFEQYKSAALAFVSLRSSDRAACQRMMVSCLVPLGRYTEALGLGADLLPELVAGDDRVAEATLREDLAQALSILGDFAGLKEAVTHLATADRIYSARGDQVRRSRAVGLLALVHERAFLLAEDREGEEPGAALRACEEAAKSALGLLYSSSLLIDPQGMRLQELRLLGALAHCRFYEKRWQSAADRLSTIREKAEALGALFVVDNAMWAYCIFRLSTDSNRHLLRQVRKRLAVAGEQATQPEDRKALAAALGQIDTTLPLVPGVDSTALLRTAMSNIKAIGRPAGVSDEGSLSDALHILERVTSPEFIAESRRLTNDAIMAIDTAVKQCATVGEFEEVIQTFVIRGDINWDMGQRIEAARDYEVAFQLIDQRPYLFSRPLDRVAVFRRYGRLFGRIVEAYARAAGKDERSGEYLERAFHFSERSRAVALAELLTLSGELLGKLPEALRVELQAAEREQREAYLHNEFLVRSDAEERRDSVRGRLWSAEERLRDVHRRALDAVPSLAEITPGRVISISELVSALPSNDMAVVQFSTAETCICVFVIQRQEPVRCLVIDFRLEGSADDEHDVSGESLARDQIRRQAAPFFDNYDRFATARKECAEITAALRSCADKGVMARLELRLAEATQLRELSRAKWVIGLRSLVKATRHVLDRSSVDGGQSLFNVLADQHVRHIVVVPDGFLQRMPFHAVLYDLAAVTYCPSSSILVHAAAMLSTKPSSALIVDNPDAGLQEATFEATLIANRFERAGIRVKRLSGRDATPEAVLEHMPKHDFTHYCGHAASDLSSPWDSCIELAAPANAEERNGKTPRGVLTARELMLRGAVRGGAVAVINGCSSGIAPDNAPTEFVGLPAAFLASGYSIVISTLCEVAAHTPAMIMDMVVRHLLDTGVSYAEALRTASLEIRAMRADGLFAYAQEQALSADMSTQQFNPDMVADLADWPPNHPIHWVPFVIWGAAWSASSTEAPSSSAISFDMRVPALHGASGALLASIRSAYALVTGGQYGEALPVINDLVERWGSSFFTHASLAQAYSALGDFERARHHELEALRQDPGSPRQHFNLGCVYMDLGFVPEARDCFQRAIALNPAYPEAWSNLAVLSNEVGVVIRCYREAFSTNPTDRLVSSELRRWEKLSRKHASVPGVLRLRWAQQALDRQDFSLARLQLALAREICGADHAAVIHELADRLERTAALNRIRSWRR